MAVLKIFLLFGIFGIFAEVLFTGVKRGLFDRDWMLVGNSYVWMFPIYGAAGILIQFLHSVFVDYNFVFRGLLYAVYILVGEFITGSFLKLLLGRCPWHYTARFAVKNVIRLDYVPVWLVFGLLIEKVLLFVA
ncbi:hypothetical protein HY485_05545 [Candidatus Woesearchaeota archaeon]|nr:hypothetical protein [Candidatus Woesearchaeota archaeon]